MTLQNPALPGGFTYKTRVFATQDLQFGSSNVPAHFSDYNEPDEHYRIERSVNLSEFMPNMPPFPSNPPVPWPFDAHNVPLMGRISIPDGPGPFPVVLFQHGNNGTFTDFAPGYLYLCELLASHGVIGVSIAVWPLMADCDTPQWPNGAPRMAKRAIYTLECLKQLRAWNEGSGAGLRHPLFSKIDLANVMLVGHSTSGSDIGLAAYIDTLDKVAGLPKEEGAAYETVELKNGANGLGPYHFGIKAIVGIEPSEPTTRFHVLPYGYPDICVDYFSIDTAFRTRWQHDTANRVDPNKPDFASGLTSRWDFFGGQHEAFNTTWPTDTFPVPEKQQQEITQLFISTIAQAVLLKKPAALVLLKDYRAAMQWFPANVKFASQYHDAQRLYLQHNQETLGFPEARVSAPFHGTVSISLKGQLKAERQRVIYSKYAMKADSYLLELSWPAAATQHRYTLELEGPLVGLENYEVISMGFAPAPVNQDVVTFQEARVPGQTELDFDIEFTGRNGHSIRFAVSEFAPLYYPDKAGYHCFQTIRIPLQRLEEAGVLRDELKTISLVFGANTAGAVFSDGIAFSK